MNDVVKYGIDLGTTNSCISKWQDGAVKVFQNNDHMNVTPSVVYISKAGRTLVGRRAASALQTDPANVAAEFKRWMGQKDLKEFPSTARSYSAEQLSAEVLKSLREDVKRQSGESVDAAVITVPAAFGALQCEATARAASLAGLEEAPLLQEPIAAAIGYGAQSGAADQRWMVFDFGGGTLDVAIVSTKDARLHVIEHQGDNLLGGKDIDRLLVERMLIPHLRSNFNIGDDAIAQSGTLFTRLKAKAEEAKIDLSTAPEATVTLLDLGVDRDGREIDTELTVHRSDLNEIMEPVFRRACDLAERALSAARLDAVDELLLVGGPTQAPLLREMLRDRFRAHINLSADPMTVVCQGAAVYASTLRRSSASIASKAGKPVVELKLAFDPVSASLNPVVAGRLLECPAGTQVKIDAEGGYWTSGWIEAPNGLFETAVLLKKSDVTTFWVYARDGAGSLFDISATEIVIRHGLAPSAPPIPHTICIEVIGANGKALLDPIFPKGTPLPAQRRMKYRTGHSLVPNNPATDIAIKLWEGEFFSDPAANEWVGNALLSNEGVKRTVPEGSDIDLVVSVDASRLITVDAFIPYLNDSISKKVYAAARDEVEYVELAKRTDTEIRNYESRLSEIEERVAEVPDRSISEELATIKERLAQLSQLAGGKSPDDPDEARRVVERAKDIRGSISQLEEKTSGVGDIHKIARLQDELRLAEEVVESFGTQLEKQQMTMLKRELNRAAGRKDDKAAKRVYDEIEGLRWRVLGKQGWFWRDLFETIKSDPAALVDRDEAEKLFRRGDACVSNGDTDGLREVVRGLWQQQPKTSADMMQERALKAGLKKM